MISVIIPSYNRKRQTLAAIQSVLAQTYTSYELIVVDDGSTIDRSEIQACVETAGHRYIHTSHAGVSAARNLGVENARGALVSFLDSDDTWLPEKLHVQNEFLKNNVELKICQTDEKWIRHGKFVNPCKHHDKAEGDAFYRSLEMCCISPSSVMLERELFCESGGFDEQMAVCEDYDLWLRITRSYPVGLIKRPLVCKYGGHDDQLSRSEPAIDRFRVYALLKLLRLTPLSDTQLDAVIGQIIKKSAILIEGASKRNNEGVRQLYQQVATQVGKVPKVKTADFASALEGVFEAVRKDILGQEASYE